MSEFPTVAIIDYGLGNLYSIGQACTHVGLRSVLVSSAEGLNGVDGIVLPGVGAFGPAMETIRKAGLAEPLQTAAAAGVPILGICLGMQLLMTESHEFGVHRGLDIIPGTVVRFPDETTESDALKVPQVGWNTLSAPSGSNHISAWLDTPLEGLSEGVNMYFVHSYYVIPERSVDVRSVTTYGTTTYCSTVISGKVVGCQYHPERSGAEGLTVYRNWARQLAGSLNPL